MPLPLAVWGTGQGHPIHTNDPISKQHVCTLSSSTCDNIIHNVGVVHANPQLALRASCERESEGAEQLTCGWVRAQLAHLLWPQGLAPQ